MKKNFKIVFLITVLLTVITSVGFIIKNNLFKSKEDKLINISELSDEFMDNYFEEISKVDSNEEKENMLIVISSSEIKNTYGAKNVIKAPNNQYILQYGSAKEKENALKEFKTDKRIESVEENGIYTTEEVDYNSWGIEKMSLDYAMNFADSNISNMKPVTAAIIDTGCDIDLFNKYYNGKISEFYNVLENSTTVMVDEHGHGTHVAGTIAEGTPSNVKILPIKVSKSGSIYTTDIVAAINYITYNKNADVINMSFGSYYPKESMQQAINAANEQNIISVAAAGNDHTEKKHYPSSFDNTISISSVNSSLNSSTFSNYGADITFTAPGSAIKSIMSKDASISKRNGNNDDDDHETISGTSMATPHAVAAVSILKGYNKKLSFENVVDLLKKSAVDLGEEGWDKYYGNGLISFKDVQFCDGTNCDEFGVYKDMTKKVISIDVTDLNFTKYNYYSITNLMGIKVNVNYSDGTNEELTIGELPNAEILNYNPTASGSQTVMVKMDDLTKEIQVTNPNDYESGWEYNTLENGKIEITGYKNHNLKIEKLYVPEVIDSKQVVSFADNFKFSESGNDIESYVYLYLPSTFTRIGNYSLSGTNIKYVYGSDNKIEVGAHAFENSKIFLIDVPIIKIEDYSFKDCFELTSIKVWEEKNAWVHDKGIIIGNYAFYNCKKLKTIEMTNEESDNLSGEIGNYAFYNCVSLKKFDLKPGSSIGEYAFYGTRLLMDVDFIESDSIGKYAFYGSGISEANFSVDFEVVNESAFENCRNLKSVDIMTGRIEKRAFWGSGVEIVGISDYVDYIAEDAFAYAPLKASNGNNSGTGKYKTVSNLGIIELATNKLIVGFTSNVGASNTKITEDVTEIGNYAFTGNNNLKKITIPANVTKIGTHAFEDCYQLSNVYMLGNSINFENDTFKRENEGEIKNEELIIYVYKDSAAKQFVKNKNLEYRHIDPDEVVVSGYKKVYKALSEVDYKDLSVKLIYHEENDREEELNLFEPGAAAPISNGVGYLLSYQDNEIGKFQYGDEYFTIEAKNSLGYLSEKNIKVSVEKLTPTYNVPENLTAEIGQKLSEIELPSGFEWMNENEVISKSGNQKYKAKYIPEDTVNYETVENIEINVSIANSKTIITPNISIKNKTYDGKTDISLSDITVSNLEKEDYSIISANSSSIDVGKGNATIKIKLSDDKFKEYSFESGKQEAEFNVDFNIVPLKIKKPSSPSFGYNYTGKEIIFESEEFDTNAMIITNGKGTNAGVYDVTVSLANDNYIWEDNTTDDVVIQFEIYKADLYVKDSSEDVTVIYDGKEHNIKMSIEYDGETTLKYMDDNGEYTLSELPKYKEVGTYKIKYKLFKNDNYKEYYGEKTLKIQKSIDYIINNYSVDETNNYISKIMVNTDINAFKSNIILGTGYGVDVDYKEINNKQLLYTGGKTRITYGSDIYKEYLNIVIGDINGDGAINSADLLKIRQHLLGTNILTGAYFLSSDINYDNTINSADLLRVRQHLLGTKPIE